ncbi:MAG: dihydrofolate synthase/folylpolyglutamate synthase [Chlamydiales bacterium]|jgi:dihydrofolate synthase/folylpolyglutamate synthase
MSIDDPQVSLAAALKRMDGLINWERDRTQRIRRDLEPVGELLARLGDPHTGPGAPMWVHVTGTKGKGTVSALVAEGLRGAGERVGVYGSPHVERVNERVRVDGHDVADGVLATALERALDARGEDATWFDTLTAAAFMIFGEARLDWAVCEVGLGGRLDSTNVIAPEVCVVTNIELEHTHVLGDTHGAIAREKAGILKPGATFVCGLSLDGQAGEAQAARVLLERAAELDIQVRFPDLGQAKGFSARNRALAACVLDAIGERAPNRSGGTPIGAHLLDEKALRAAALPGRLEQFSLAGVPVILDGAHVASSVAMACAELEGRPDLPGRPVAVLSLATDKDARAILKALKACVDRVVCTTIKTGRHLAANELCELAQGEGLVAHAVPDPDQAVLQAAKLAASGWVLVTGSLYLAGATRPALRRTNEC